ncbi:transglycosylase SLT domain-containing protein [Oceanisphaera arctica]|uniref:transglycosylase SLT domain-containing protein n=1 Tax=Oceanisphaera arctica TaxID=641510 RepID=UPI0019C2D637|nr:transglycosylase SLT domain-containing protein [Oceanisphaera arctica]GHA27200.1 murein transglycosylase [Oceanisphaera arctica]
MRGWLGVGLLLLSLGVSVQASPLREQYRQAEQALKKNDLALYERLRQGLDAYPLTVYLDFQYLDDRMQHLTTAQVIRFMTRYSDSLLADRLERRYLFRLAREQRWQEFLALYPALPNSVELQCAHYRARWATGGRATAIAGAERLWLHGYSRPDICNPLFDAWSSIGGRNDEHIWQRMLLAFEHRQDGLLAHLGRQLSSSARPAGDFLLSLDKDPELLAGSNLLVAGSERHKAALAQALSRLADTKPELVMSLYPKYQRQSGLSQPLVAGIERQLARRLMFNRTQDYRGWLDSRLPVVGDADLFELRSRLAIWEQDWRTLPGWIDRLPVAAQQDSRWQYWRGRALKAQNRHAEGDKAWQQAAQNRDYYGFLAAQQGRHNFSLQKKPLVSAPPLSQARLQWPALSRVEEWLALGDKTAARTEWYHLLGRVNEADGLALGSLALSRGWYDKSIVASIQVRAWDHLDLRFPVVYRELFQRQARKLGVDEATLFAIARQESAFYEQARSPVGAGGLMQLMPATARETARKHGISGYQDPSDVYRPEVNVQLGSSYFKELLGRYDNNRVPAIAAYNAGPSRINRWLKESGSRPMDVWVENIPYRETRGYVQNVLAFSVIYQDMLGQKKTFLKPAELNDVY